MALTIEDIRTYVKDMPYYNVLLRGNPQSSDKLIELAMRLTVSDFNAVPPVMNYTLENFPVDGIMLYGVLYHLAISEAERQLRNQVDYAMQGLTTAIDNKFPQYQQLASYYKGLFDQNISSFKTYVNQEEAWGGSWSPYAVINEYQYRD